MLDPAPRVVIDSEVGLVALGADARGARAACEIYEHTVDVIARAEMLERWAPLEPADVFDVEYWELEQAKLGRRDPGKPFLGENAVVTGAASGIGRACVERFLELGAAVAGLDLDPAVACVADGDAFLGLVCDIAQPSSTADAVARAVAEFGGLDMLVINAGIFPASAPIAELDLDTWRRTMAVNADGNVALLRAAAPILRLSPRGGRVVVNASKNVPAPGPGAAAYSASKAALTQLARVAALEWAHDGIRVNVVHPNGVFDTGLWTDDVLERRAAAYGLSVDAYRTNNLLGVEVRSRDVAGVITTLCDTVFSRTTGCQIPVDGGNERVV
jgi:NAD(P)-dependent dehydrogenase (short-subunit alcohol dehydrogenase family)